MVVWWGFMKAMPQNNTGAVLTKTEAAELLRIKPRTLDEWMRHKRIPYSKLPGGTVRFRRDQLLDFIQKFQVGSN